MAPVDDDEEEDGVVEDEDEFEHLDDEEFEGIDQDTVNLRKGKDQTPPPLEITKIPLHLRTNWDSFYLEMLMLAGLAVYFLNFIAGKTKNSKLATAWFDAHKELLHKEFSIVGDDGQSKEPTENHLLKESEHTYSLWCSGRVCCEGMLVELKLLKRQDLINTISRMLSPKSDQILIKVTMEETEMDSFVFAVAQKKVASKLLKEQTDLNFFCAEKKGIDKGNIPPSLQVLSEIGEATSAVFDKTFCAVLNRYESNIEFIHFSDQYSGPKQQDQDTPTTLPETKKVLLFCFNVGDKGRTTVEDMDGMKELLQLVIHCIDKVKRIKLTKEAKMKAEKNRQRMHESYLKQTHSQRQEAAQLRREEKRRTEKERIMNEEDPDKQRKLEERENRREMKRKQPKMKMMKVKSM
ncbi:coiled-coil domain-containing protein 47 [Lingula anatina]|uniref:PAT complex subunit CCDC47 n=1 Tax=Lingula anatina TaxID=7574 RepID=A0A1S3HGR7_LINAN|nr:coiled-coil domain-containing protein 47 [Lingula anatina]|eukprot:XP_013384671.1 coiled-coil domain-containing protein 47 [Lingula anatina]